MKVLPVFKRKMSSVPSSSSACFPSHLPWSPCKKDPCDPLDCLVEGLDSTSPLTGTVKPYKHHFLIGSSFPWPSQIQSLHVPGLLDLLNASKSVRDPSESLLVSVVDGIEGILSFPSHVSFPAGTPLSGLLKEGEGVPLPGSVYVFVCMHAARDQRCGTLGPLIIQALRAEIQSQGLASRVHVHGISHVGGTFSTYF